MCPDLLDELRAAGATRLDIARIIQLDRAAWGRIRVMSRAIWFQLLMARTPWARPLTVWRPPEGVGPSVALVDLLRTLLTRFPVPDFLFEAFSRPGIDLDRLALGEAWNLRLIAHLGQGHSLREAGPDVLPVALSRRMRRTLLRTPDGLGPVAAIRRAQVLGMDGPEPLAARLMYTRLGRIHSPTGLLGEPFWRRVLAWLCLHSAEVASWSHPVLGRFVAGVHGLQAECVRDGRCLKLTGRPPRAILRDIDGWQAREDARGQAGSFPADGLLHDVFELGDGWRVCRLRTPVALVKEGQAMAHCVARYLDLARQGQVSIWSLRADSTRVLTIEMVPCSQQIVQVRGFANRVPTGDELAVLTRWMRRAGLRSHWMLGA